MKKRWQKRIHRYAGSIESRKKVGERTAPFFAHRRRPSNIKFHAERKSRTLHAVTRCKVIFVFGDGRERGDSLSPSLGKVEGRSGVGEEEASRGRIRDRVETREGGEGRCECSALLALRVAVSCCRTCQLRSRSCGGFLRR